MSNNQYGYIVKGKLNPFDTTPSALAKTQKTLSQIISPPRESNLFSCNKSGNYIPYNSSANNKGAQTNGQLSSTTGQVRSSHTGHTPC
jgi:hypothetical protein